MLGLDSRDKVLGLDGKGIAMIANALQCPCRPRDAWQGVAGQKKWACVMQTPPSRKWFSAIGSEIMR